MDDSRIIELYFIRDEAAVNESRLKYGAYCYAVADNILRSREDSEECVSDTWLSAWNSIPPARPRRLSVFFGRITRNLAIDRYRRSHAARRGDGDVPLCLDELSECVGEDSPIENRVALKLVLDSFLRGLSEANRCVFLYRYWYCMPVAEIARRRGVSEGAVKMSLQRTRERLREYLDREGIGV